MVFAVIGGDMRQAKLAELLAADGHSVRTAALDKAAIKGTDACECIGDAVKNAEYIILPLPVLAGGEKLNAPFAQIEPNINEVLNNIGPEQTMLAGLADIKLRGLISGRGLRMVDYFEREELTVKNAVTTAEGAVQILMEEMPVTLQHAKCLVVGFGRVGKITALKLKALGADVTASARSYEDFAWIDALGLKSADTRKLENIIGQYEAIVNTVPARVLNDELLRRVRDGCLCLDLASKPGGMDFEAASRLGVKAIWALSLPGRVAPVTSGSAIKEAIYNIISELECAD